MVVAEEAHLEGWERRNVCHGSVGDFVAVAKAHVLQDGEQTHVRQCSISQQIAPLCGWAVE